jgi:hypothetical protein
LVLVKGDYQKRSQVNPTNTQILALVKGSRQMRSQVDQVTNIILTLEEKMRKTLPLRNSQKKKRRKFKPCHQEE